MGVVALAAGGTYALYDPGGLTVLGAVASGPIYKLADWAIGGLYMMTWCNSHWSQLRTAIVARGMWGLVQTPEELSANLAAIQEGGQSTERFDPLISCWGVISDSVARHIGVYAACGCPLCALGAAVVAEVIVDKCADQASQFALAERLVTLQ